MRIPAGPDRSDLTASCDAVTGVHDEGPVSVAEQHHDVARSGVRRDQILVAVRVAVHDRDVLEPDADEVLSPLRGKGSVAAAQDDVYPAECCADRGEIRMGVPVEVAECSESKIVAGEVVPSDESSVPTSPQHGRAVGVDVNRYDVRERVVIQVGYGNGCRP